MRKFVFWVGLTLFVLTACQKNDGKAGSKCGSDDDCKNGFLCEEKTCIPASVAEKARGEATSAASSSPKASGSAFATTPLTLDTVVKVRGPDGKIADYKLIELYGKLAKFRVGESQFFWREVIEIVPPGAPGPEPVGDRAAVKGGEAVTIDAGPGREFKGVVAETYGKMARVFVDGFPDPQWMPADRLYRVNAAAAPGVVAKITQATTPSAGASGADALCQCYKQAKGGDCKAMNVARSVADCVRGYAGNCAMLIACIEGEPGAMPVCGIGHQLGPPGVCYPSCEPNGCASGLECDVGLGICVPAGEAPDYGAPPPAAEPAPPAAAAGDSGARPSTPVTQSGACSEACPHGLNNPGPSPQQCAPCPAGYSCRLWGGDPVMDDPGVMQCVCDAFANSTCDITR